MTTTRLMLQVNQEGSTELRVQFKDAEHWKTIPINVDVDSALEMIIDNLTRKTDPTWFLKSNQNG